jgi:hypothetical protein
MRNQYISALAVSWHGSLPLVAQTFDSKRFDELHRMVLPRDGDLKWMSVPWLTSITLARHQAATEGKPLFVFADTGAGFADALGLC